MEFRSCTQPWFEMQLMYNRVSRFCCYHDNVAFDELDIPSVWNSELFQKTRAEIAGGNPKGTRCEACPYIKYVDAPLFLTIPDHVTGARRQNWERALEHFKNGDAKIESLPVKYYVQFGLACNLRCIMCDHPVRFNGGENQTFDPNILFSRTDYLRLATSIHIIGGEPFLIPSAVDFIKTAATRKDLWDLEYNFYTNGFLLDRYIETIGNFERVVATISLDSHGKHYEYIRRRASWSRLSTNVAAFRKFAKDKGYPWRVHIACVLMKSGIAGLTDLMKWCVDNEAMIHFAPIFDQTAVGRDEENIFGNPELLCQIPGWEKNIEDAIGVLKSAGWHNSQNQLSHLYLELADKYSAWAYGKANREQELRRLRLENYHRCLFENAELPITERLNRHIYVMDKSEGALVNDGRMSIFQATHPKDHLATDFFDIVPHVPGRSVESDKRYVKIETKWPDGRGSQRCDVVLQDQSCNPIKLYAESKGDSEEEYFQIPEGVEKVRLVIYGEHNGRRLLPDKLRMEIC